MQINIHKSITIVTMAFDGYERFIPQYVEYIRRLKPKPKEVILVLPMNTGFKENIEGITIIKSDATTMGGYLNAGIKCANSDIILSFSVDDELLENAIEEIQVIDADIITLKYYCENKVMNTPEMKKERIKDWKKYYINASGYLAFKKQYVDDTDFWKYPLLFKTILEDKIIKSTNNPCAVWHKRPGSHGAGQNAARGEIATGEYANKYLSKKI